MLSMEGGREGRIELGFAAKAQEGFFFFLGVGVGVVVRVAGHLPCGGMVGDGEGVWGICIRCVQSEEARLSYWRRKLRWAGEMDMESGME